jgi:hypothetical protein
MAPLEEIPHFQLLLRMAEVMVAGVLEPLVGMADLEAAVVKQLAA